MEAPVREAEWRASAGALPAAWHREAVNPALDRAWSVLTGASWGPNSTGVEPCISEERTLLLRFVCLRAGPGGAGRGRTAAWRGGEGRPRIPSVNQSAFLAVTQVGPGRAADRLVTAASTAVVTGALYPPTS